MQNWVWGSGLGVWLLSLLGGVTPAGAAPFDDHYPTWNQVLSRYETEKGLIRYRELKADAAKQADHPLHQFTRAIAAVTRPQYEAFSREQKIAFWINSYNALTLKLVMENYPVTSMKKIGGFFSSPWKTEFFSLVEGKAKTLDQIEHDILRQEFKEPRVHAALNCSALSCPRLQNHAFVAETLSPQLDQAMTQWLADPTRNHFDAEKGSLSLSKLFDWYGKDFVAGFGGIYQAVEKYGPPLAKSLASQKARVKFLPYDWSLNDAASESLTDRRS